jgi:YD repeat-containing protein
MSKIIFVIFLLGTYGNGYAQYQANLPASKPIPPNAAALFKILERPLGTYTGTVPISFPLCSLGSGPLSADIALNYTATGGIRVEELASCVGLGFNLSDGAGRITEIIHGQPDNSPAGYVHNTTAKPSTFVCTNMTQEAAYATGILDLEPDSYMYSFNGRSGRFVMKEDGSIALLQNDGIKISYNYNSSYGRIDAWTITDEKGNTYHYGTFDFNQSSYTSSHGSTSNTTTSESWYLDRIDDMNQENSLKFSYTGTGSAFTTLSGMFYPLDVYLPSCTGFNTFSDIGTVTTDGSEYLVSRIDGRSGFITFSTASDYSGGPLKVTALQLYDSNSVMKKQFHFNYGTSFSSSRFRLASFSEIPIAGTDSITTKFDYITSGTQNLPAVTSYNVDIWGFYNGASNSGYVPNIAYINGGYQTYRDDWDNRVANGFYAQANLLKRITYPTGGYRELDYESNRVLPSGDFFLYHPDPAYMATRTFSETHFTNNGTFMPSMQHLFTVKSYFGLTKFYFTLGSVGGACGTSYNVKLYKLTDSTDLTGGFLVTTFNGVNSGNYVLLKGYYRLDFTLTANNFCTVGSMNGNWPECTLDTVTYHSPNWPGFIRYSKWEHNAGGVRVKEVRDYDPLTAKTYRTDYYYKLYSADSTHTSGLLASPVNITALENIAGCNCSYHKLYQGSAYPLSTEGSSYVVYPEVRTVDSAGGRTDQLFNFTQDVLPIGFPLAPPTDYSPYRGKLISQTVYDQSGTLLKKTFHTHHYGTNIFQTGIKVKPYWGGQLGTYYEYSPDGSSPTLAGCTSYAAGLPPVVLAQTIDSVFSAFGTQVLRTDYTYTTNNNNFFLQKTTRYINGNRTKEETAHYAFNINSDFNLGLSASEQSMKTSLLGLNYFQPLEVVDSIKTNGSGATFLGGSKSIFGTFNGSKIHLSKSRSFTSAVDSVEWNGTTYDARGNCAESYKTNDVNQVVLWGYRGMYPVARITGSNYSTVAGFVNLSTINNPSSDSVMRVELAKIRTGLAGSMAQVTSYTYAPQWGMTSMTDPAGRTEYYEYDAYGRLKTIRDQNRNILQQFNYKFNNP